MSTQPVVAQQGKWYLGVGAGVSRLAPETEDSDYSLDDEVSAAGGLYLGFDIGDRFGVEAAYTRLGEAGLSEGESIEYSAYSLGGIAYVLGETSARRREQGWSGYLRLGVNQMDNQSDLALNEEDNTSVLLGAGFQWPMSGSWGLRGELTSHDSDAQAALASVYWRPGARSGGSTLTSRVASPPLPQQQRGGARIATPRPSPKTVASTRVAQNPASTAVALPSGSSCAVPAAGEPLDNEGCAMFSGVQQGIEFEGDTTELTREGETKLMRLADSLSWYPGMVVEIRVHTQAFPEPERARNLSRARAVAVATYLVERGVDVKRLKARAFGSSQPRASNATAEGRQLNNRVALRVL